MSKRITSLSALIAFALASLVQNAAAKDMPIRLSAPKPLKVFILAGQSNMEGHAQVRTFDYMALCLL